MLIVFALRNFNSSYNKLNLSTVRAPKVLRVLLSQMRRMHTNFCLRIKCQRTECFTKK